MLTEHPKPKPRFKLQKSETEHHQSASRAVLLKEIDRLTEENEELSRSQHSNQDSGYQHSKIFFFSLSFSLLYIVDYIELLSKNKISG